MRGFSTAPAIHGKFTDARAGPETKACGLPAHPPKHQNACCALAGRRGAVFHPSLDLTFEHPSVFYKRQLSQILRKAANAPCMLQMGKWSPGKEP